VGANAPASRQSQRSKREGIVPSFDPVQGFAAQGVPRDPVGAPDELAAHKLPTKLFYSCSEPSHDGANIGCRHWFECTMSYKGLPASEGGGPRSHCWERIKSPAQGGGIVRGVHPCFYGVSQQDVCHENGEILRVIADEGEEYEMLTTVPDPSGGRDNFGFFKWDQKLLKLKVEPFKRLGEEQTLAQHELRDAE
jgi:hypothetical protein